MPRERARASSPRASRALGALVRCLDLPLRAPRSARAPAGAVPRAAVIIVLGAGLDLHDRLTSASQERVVAAAELWHRGGAPRVVTTGGKTRGAARSEAEVMAEELITRGVPPSAITCEQASLTTRDNARRCAELLLPAGAPALPVWLVTQPFHGRRARWLFGRAGFLPSIWSLADSIQYRDPVRGVQWTVREYLAWLKAFLTELT
jgi:uncharacterized SAM-binding protein YcdF (DUF218 family)